MHAITAKICFSSRDRMMCEAVEVWSLPLLVGAFLNLLIAFLLLCAASIAYSSSKFLDAFSLRLRCPCEGLFDRKRRKGGCVWRDLSERLVEKVASVQVSVTSRSLLGSITMEGQKSDDVGDGNGYAVSESKGSLGLQKFEGLFGEADQGDAAFCGVDSDAAKYRQLAVKGKGVLNLRRRSGLGPRRKGFARHGNISSCSSRDDQIAGSGANHKIGATSPSCFRPGPDDLPRVIPMGVHAEEEGSQSSSIAKAIEGCCGTEKNKLKMGDWDNVGNSCRIVEESVREMELAAKVECAGCVSLCLELEKERNAAASSADEAMAMIMRLQREKASVEMEAKQYRRMIEEKSAFNAMEMNILKEILVRREMEKHFLEKEVEAYRQITFTNEQFENSLIDYASMQKLEIFSSKEGDVDSMRRAESINGSNDNVQEKVAISLGRTLYAGNGGPLLNSNEPLSVSEQLSSQEVEESTIRPERLGEGNGDGSLVNVFSDDTKDAHSDSLDISQNSNSLGAGSRVHDVHVVGFVPGKSSRNKDGGKNRSAMNPSRSSSDLVSIMPHGRTVLSNFRRRNSMSAVDSERARMDNEVEKLTQRLRKGQEGREKLKICGREWGSESDPGDGEHLESLPPLSSEVVLLKKRRWRSVSMGGSRA